MLNRRFIAIVAGVIMVYLGINAFAQPSADTTPPTITLIGSAEMTINVGTNFVDPGATAQDDVDGDLTSEIVVTGSVDEDIPGVYQLRYNVSDKARNAAEEVVRTVNVVQPEVEEPIIMLNSDNPLIVNVGSTYTDPFGTVLVDGEVIATLTLENRTGELDTNRLGTYLLYYNYPGALEVIRVVRVVDRTAPVITLLGDAVVNHEAGTPYTDAEATALDNYYGDLTANIVVNNPVDTSKLGTYTITYNVIDGSGNSAAEVTRIVTVQDTIDPVLTINDEGILIRDGNYIFEALYGGKLKDIEPLVTAYDQGSGDLTNAIVKKYERYGYVAGSGYIWSETNNEHTVQNANLFRITYTVTDAANHSVTQTINIKVVSMQPDTLMINGDVIGNFPIEYVEATYDDIYVDTITPTAYSQYDDKTYNAELYEICYNNQKSGMNECSKTLTIPLTKLGTYKLNYRVFDSHGHVKYGSRTVTVQDTIDPVIQGVEDGHYYNTDVTITIVEENIASVTVNDVEITLDSNKQYTFTENGQYRVVVTDEANHQATVSFIIDKNAPKNPIVTPKKRQTIEVLQPFDINSIVVSFYDKEENTYYFGERYLIEYRVDNKAKFGAVDSLDTAKAGEYKIHYRASDMAGNEATTVAYVDVVVPNETVYNETQKKTYNGLNKAINNANPGDKILIGPGNYKNYFVIDKDGLTLKGFGKKEDIIIMSNKNGCFEITTNNVTLENLTIKASKNYTSAPVIHLIGANDVNIINNIVEANYTKTGQPAIGTSSGPARATGLIKGNTVTGAIGVGTAGNLEVSNNTILNAYSEGIWFYPIEPTAELIIKNNKVMNHAYGDSTAKQLKVTSRPASINGKTTDDKIYKNILNNNKITTVKFDWITYDNIQAAIDAANINDKIIVAPGVYNEHLTINKEGIKLVSLLGTSETIINGTITIHTVDNVLVEGFTVIAPVDYKATPVIHMIDADNVTILDNIVEANYQLTGQPAIGTSTGPARVTGLIKGNTVTGAIGVGTDGKLEIINNTILNAYSEGIWFGPITSTAELTIRNNKILNWAAIEPTAKKIKIVSKPASINGKKDDNKMLNAIVNSNKDITDTDVNFVWLAP